MTLVSDVMATVPSMGVRLCSVPNLPGISGQKKPRMLPSGHVCQWVHCFDPLLIFKRRVLLSLVFPGAKASSSEVFFLSASICNVIHVGKWVLFCWKVPKPVMGQQCYGGSNMALSKYCHPFYWLDFSGVWNFSWVLFSQSPPRASTGIWTFPASLFFPQVWPLTVSGDTQLGPPPAPFSSWNWILPNQGLTWVLLVPLVNDMSLARLGFSIDFIDIILPQTLKHGVCLFLHIKSDLKLFYHYNKSTK